MTTVSVCEIKLPYLYRVSTNVTPEEKQLKQAESISLDNVLDGYLLLCLVEGSNISKFMKVLRRDNKAPAV